LEHSFVKRESEVYPEVERKEICRHGRNEGTRGAQFPGSRATVRGAEKPNHVTQALSSTSIKYICFRMTAGSNMGAPNLLLVPGAI